jgi:hypothetical protein
MFGEAFKCDQCGRVTFVPNNQTLAQGGPPPYGWFALSTVGEPDQHWPMWHFDTAQCLAEFTDGILPEVTADQYREMTDEMRTDVPVPDEQVLSEWDASVDQPAG